MSDTIKNEKVRKLELRVEHLEKLTRWHLFALDLLASLGEFQSSNANKRDPGAIFEITRKQVKRLLDFRATAFYLVNENDSEFYIANAEPDSLEKVVSEEVDALIENGTFAYALSQNRPVSAKCENLGEMLILHVLATKSRVRGMFVGIADKSGEIYNEMVLYTLSIMMQATANSLESAELYRIMFDNNKILEEKVQKRTSELEKKNQLLSEEVSNRKRAEAGLMLANQQAEEAYQAKTDYVAKVSYEIRTQVNSILGNSDILSEELGENMGDELKSSIGKIKDSTRVLLNLVDEIISS